MQKKFWKEYTSPMSRMRQAWGFGIHSPFAFRLITKVIREKARYYAYDDVEAIARTRVIDALQRRQKRQRRLISKSRGRLFFRLTNFFRPDDILEIGSSWGISSLYLRLAERSARLTIVEPNAEIGSFAEQLFAEAGEQAEFVREPHAIALPDYLAGEHEGFYIVVNRLPKAQYRALPRLLDPALDKPSILIIDGIRRNSAVKEWWELLLKDERVRVTVDMKNVGFVCCNPKLNKQDYQVSL